MADPTVLQVVGTIDRSMVDRMADDLTLVDNEEDELLIVEPPAEEGEA